MPAKHRIFTTPVANVYPYYVAKAEKKGRTKAEVDEVICWLTGYTPKQLARQLALKTDFETFFAKAPKMNPKRKLVIASNANWTRATMGPEGAAREAFYKQVQTLLDAGK